MLLHGVACQLRKPACHPAVPTKCICFCLPVCAVPREVGPPPGGPDLVRSRVPVVFFTPRGVPGELRESTDTVTAALRQLKLPGGQRAGGGERREQLAEHCRAAGLSNGGRCRRLAKCSTGLLLTAAELAAHATSFRRRSGGCSC